MKKPKDLILVIFGASGDLTVRKLIPALFNLFRKKQMPDHFAVLGLGRTALDDVQFRQQMEAGIERYGKNKGETPDIKAFCQHLCYIKVDPSFEADYVLLKEKLETLGKECPCDGNYIFYMATPPSLFEIIPQHLQACGLNKQNSILPTRLVVEKPFGVSLESARALNQKLQHYFDESQIYRIDHYLGKETVQNMLVTRFANGIFEPLWNRNFVERVEITSAESIGIENRGAFYDRIGALRDMLQNHLLQLLALVAMEPPSQIDATAIRNEVVKVFHALRPIKEENVAKQVVRAQYSASGSDEAPMAAYLEEKSIQAGSRTESYVAMKCYVDNWRWGGVPFYIRTGKRLPAKMVEIVIHFKETPHRLFCPVSSELNHNNQLVIRIQPNEGIVFKFNMKVPGAGFKAQPVDMNFNYNDLGDPYISEAYERLLLDCMNGDATLFTRGDAVEAAWKFVDPVLTAWDNDQEIPLYMYPAGSWGPTEADKLIEGENTAWRKPF
ncbi:MAG: glucose-6-phosphate dehydrogenase [Bacteroidales bacterium]|nr:glucose-6-phosphate dehydrogenase [Bacteroidales bacterium]